MDGAGRIAQLVRASLLHREGQGFESLCAHLNTPTQGGICFFLPVYGDIRLCYFIHEINLLQPAATIFTIQAQPFFLISPQRA